VVYYACIRPSFTAKAFAHSNRHGDENRLVVGMSFLPTSLALCRLDFWRVHSQLHGRLVAQEAS